MAFGNPVGTTQEEIVSTVATILYYKMSVDDVRLAYNRTIQVEFVDAAGGNATAFALGFLAGLGYVRTGRRQDTTYAFDAMLVRQRMLEMALDLSDSTSSDCDVPARVPHISTDDESSASEDEASFLQSDESSENK